VDHGQRGAGMSILAAVRNILLRSIDVNSVVGDRIYPGRIPQGTSVYPAAECRIASTQVEHDIKTKIGFYHTLVVVEVFSPDDPDTADAVADAMLDELTGWQGTEQDCHIRGVEASSGIMHTLEEVEPGSDKALFVSSIGFMIHWSKL